MSFVSTSRLLFLSLGLKCCALQKASVSKYLSKKNYPLSKGPEYGFSQSLLQCLILHYNLLGSYCASCNGGYIRIFRHLISISELALVPKGIFSLTVSPFQ